MNRYNNPQPQQLIMPQGEVYSPMNMIGMNMNQNTISLDQFIERASNSFPGKFYVIKSLEESNILSSIRFKIWCSTIKGNQKLQKAYKEADKKYPIFLFFSVNGSGKFMGIALMNSEVEYKPLLNSFKILLIVSSLSLVTKVILSIPFFFNKVTKDI